MGNERISYAVLEDNVAVPTHFFRILVRKMSDSSIETQTFLVPNTGDINSGIEQYLTSIENIEFVPGLNFFSSLSEQEKAKIKSTVSKELW